MCGIAGLYAYGYAAPTPSRRELQAMTDRMAARGPDGDGAWSTAGGRCLLGHRRLSIIDLDSRANQPMLSDDGALAVTYNGEIYNYLDLRRDLEARGRRFRTTSDTEVLLHLYEEHGEAMLPMLRGMFALALWDNRRQGLLLARDPYGIKPLYYANDGWTLRFASQVKGLLAGGAISRDIDPAGLTGFMLFGAPPEPFTAYRAIQALPAGCFLWADSVGVRAPQPYASVAAALSEGRGAVRLSSAEIEDGIRRASLASVRRHLLADVEVGLFLSAGIDSGALLGLMRDAGQDEIRTVTLGFEEYRGGAEDETPLAETVAAHYGARHTTRWVGEAEFRRDLPAILDAMDQPSIDGINTWFVSKAAREMGLKVALSGLGGDELLGGYPSFVDVPRWTGWLGPMRAMPGLGAGLRALAAKLAPELAARSPKVLGLIEHGASYPGAYLVRRAVFLPFELQEQLDPDVVDQGLARLAPIRGLAAGMAPDPRARVARICALESTNYMRNQLLRDADWAGMAHSLEVRTPLVDMTLLEDLAPIIGQLRPGQGKQMLARAPSKPLPAAVAERAKTGFTVPTGRWTASALADGETPLPASKGQASRQWARRLADRLLATPQGGPPPADEAKAA